MKIKKRKTPFEIILFLFVGMKPKEIIKKGYSKATVYKYSRNFPDIQKKFLEKK